MKQMYWMKFIIFNCMILGIVLYLSQHGLLDRIWDNSALYIIPAISTLWLVGFLSFIWSKRVTNWVWWCSNGLVGLGFIGTLYGISSGFEGADQLGSAQEATEVVGQALKGISTAILTTLWGVMHKLWLDGVISLHEEE